jgi:hypothetical protein
VCHRRRCRKGDAGIIAIVADRLDLQLRARGKRGDGAYIDTAPLGKVTWDINACTQLGTWSAAVGQQERVAVERHRGSLSETQEAMDRRAIPAVRLRGPDCHPAPFTGHLRRKTER